jgi:hypothetical protein
MTGETCSFPEEIFSYLHPYLVQSCLPGDFLVSATGTVDNVGDEPYVVGVVVDASCGFLVVVVSMVAAVVAVVVVAEGVVVVTALVAIGVFVTVAVVTTGTVVLAAVVDMILCCGAGAVVVG